jgi:hypothetical protein
MNVVGLVGVENAGKSQLLLNLCKDPISHCENYCKRIVNPTPQSRRVEVIYKPDRFFRYETLLFSAMFWLLKITETKFRPELELLMSKHAEAAEQYPDEPLYQPPPQPFYHFLPREFWPICSELEYIVGTFPSSNALTGDILNFPANSRIEMKLVLRHYEFIPAVWSSKYVQDAWKARGDYPLSHSILHDNLLAFLQMVPYFQQEVCPLSLNPSFLDFSYCRTNGAYLQSLPVSTLTNKAIYELLIAHFHTNNSLIYDKTHNEWLAWYTQTTVFQKLYATYDQRAEFLSKNSLTFTKREEQREKERLEYEAKNPPKIEVKKFNTNMMSREQEDIIESKLALLHSQINFPLIDPLHNPLVHTPLTPCTYVIDTSGSQPDTWANTLSQHYPAKIFWVVSLSHFDQLPYIPSHRTLIHKSLVHFKEFLTSHFLTVKPHLSTLNQCVPSGKNGFNTIGITQNELLTSQFVPVKIAAIYGKWENDLYTAHKTLVEYEREGFPLPGLDPTVADPESEARYNILKNLPSYFTPAGFVDHTKNPYLNEPILTTLHYGPEIYLVFTHFDQLIDKIAGGRNLADYFPEFVDDEVEDDQDDQAVHPIKGKVVDHKNGADIDDATVDNNQSVVVDSGSPDRVDHVDHADPVDPVGVVGASGDDDVEEQNVETEQHNANDEKNEQTEELEEEPPLISPKQQAKNLRRANLAKNFIIEQFVRVCNESKIASHHNPQVAVTNALIRDDVLDQISPLLYRPVYYQNNP